MLGAGGAPGAAASVLGHWADDGGGKDHGGGGDHDHGGGGDHDHGGGGGGGGGDHDHGDNEHSGGGGGGGGGGGDASEAEGGQKPVGEIDGVGDGGKTPKAKAAPVEVKNDGSLKGIRGNVKLTAPIAAGYALLSPYLPGGVVMTSGLRSDADQARIINEYFASKGGPKSITDVEQKRVWLVTKKGMKIAKVGSSPHRTGLAFDLSGAALGSIRAAVTKCAKEKKGQFKLAGTILEPKNNCLHVNLSG